jgi:hypothetical protein
MDSGKLLLLQLLVNRKAGKTDCLCEKIRGNQQKRVQKI